MKINRLFLTLATLTLVGGTLASCGEPVSDIRTDWTTEEKALFNQYFGEGNILPFYYFDGMEVLPITSDEEGKFMILQLQVITTAEYVSVVDPYIDFMYENDWYVDDSDDEFLAQIVNESGNVFMVTGTENVDLYLELNVLLYYNTWPGTLLEANFPADAEFPSLDLEAYEASAYVFGSWEEEGTFFGIQVLDLTIETINEIIIAWNAELVELGYEERVSADPDVGTFYHNPESGLNSRAVSEKDVNNYDILMLRINNQDPNNY